LKIFDTTEITIMQTIFLVLKHPTNMEFLCISEVAAGKIHVFISN
jgi:hypothetical protein